MTDKNLLRLDPSHWEQRYVDGLIPWDTGEPDIHLRAFLDRFQPAPCTTLDIGCGTGTNGVWLQSLGFDVTGVDVSTTAIDMSLRRARAAGQSCRFVVADLRSETIGAEAFGLAYDRGCFHIFADAKDSAHFAARIAAHLEDGGLWCSVLGSTDGPPRDTGPPRRSAAQICAAVEPHFEILELKACVFDEGMHSAACAWVLVARKRSP